MKRFTLAMMMFAGLLSSCSTDDQAVYNEDNVGLNENVAVQSVQTLANCTEASALGGSATLSCYTGPQITFNWNNSVDYAADKTYVSYIELVEDAACPAPVYGTPVAATYPIDVFNTSSLVVPSGVSAKCFKWRIVINGYVDTVLSCTTTTEWMDATYVQ